MGLDIGYIAGVKSRDPKHPTRDVEGMDRMAVGRCFMRIHRFMGDSTSPRTVVVYIYTYIFCMT